MVSARPETVNKVLYFTRLYIHCNNLYIANVSLAEKQLH